MLPDSMGYSINHDAPIYKRDVNGKEIHGILAYESFPKETFGLPVAWITGPTQPETLLPLGVPAAAIKRIINWKAENAGRASKLLFTTRVAQEGFLAQFGERWRRKCAVVPFFLPENEMISIDEKWRKAVDEPEAALSLLFVGRQARRKGLVKMLKAVVPMLRENTKLQLNIVSSFSDGAVDVPNLPNIRVLGEQSKAAVMQLMAEAHLLLMVSSWESYGFTYIEALSRGCVPVALDRPIQRELLEPHGILMPSDEPKQMEEILRGFLMWRGLLQKMALGGQGLFAKRYSPEAVAWQFYSALMDMVRVRQTVETVR